MADGSQYVILEDSNNPWRLGWHVNHDPRNRNFRALEGAVEPAKKPKRIIPWYTNTTCYQIGSSCTCNCDTALLRTQPNNSFRSLMLWRLLDTPQKRFNFYVEAQECCDPWPGSEITSPMYEGSSSDAVPKLMKQKGYIKEWRWLFGLDEVIDYLRYYGPCGLGTIWMKSMFNVGPDGYINVNREGSPAGGHEYRLVYHDDKRQASLVHNSWENWGMKIHGQPSRAWLRDADADWLLQSDGDAHVLTV